MFAPDPRLIALRDALEGQVLHGNTSYHLRERIGEGGQGWVFKANWDEPSGLVVIVKVLRPDAVNDEALRRFQREAEVLRLLSQGRPNPHIVRFFDHAVARVKSPLGGDLIPLPFTVLEYVNGPTLEHVLKTVRGRGLPVERVRRLVRQVVLALDVVHAQRVVHRDLKPSNILLANEAGTEIAKVTDFGLVKVVDVSLQRTTSLAGASLG
jgi:serine/threonine-protein kinase